MEMEAREVLFSLVYAHFHPGRANCPQRAANLTAPSGFLCGAARGPTVLLRRPESGVAMRIKRYEVVAGSTLERGPPFFDKPTPSTQFRCVSCPNVFTVPGDERHAVDNGGALGKWKRCDPCSPLPFCSLCHHHPTGTGRGTDGESPPPWPRFVGRAGPRVQHLRPHGQVDPAVLARAPLDQP